MICFEAYMPSRVLSFFQENRAKLVHFEASNRLLKQQCGINFFFKEQEELEALMASIQESTTIVAESERRAYGDFQTSLALASQVVQYVKQKQADIEFVLEPTCGKGHFLVSVLEQFKQVKKVVGVEIFKPYVWETKFNILSHFLQNTVEILPDIDIFHANVFDFDFYQLGQETKTLKTLIIGNPPWVTNAELGTLASGNLPKKTNFKKHTGLDALTGKGNFDIGESILIRMLDVFHQHQGMLSFLVKNAVIKNIIQDQIKNRFRIAKAEKLMIDSKKEFNVSVHAALFVAQLNREPEMICQASDFYSQKRVTQFGWYKNKFVNSIADYDASSRVEGKSVFTWRSGIKHDCSKVMELEKIDGRYRNALGEMFRIEDGLVYGLLKSSDLKLTQANQYRKLTIITQKKIGQDTNYIESFFPLTYQYLLEHQAFFDRRKSSIYKGKPRFSIFGVGEYSFAPYKVAISAMYKTTHFTLVLPDGKRPVMLDDTCYFIGFQDVKLARVAHFLLNLPIVQQFLKSIIFSDAKRSINKDILMRIDLRKVFLSVSFAHISSSLDGITEKDWKAFGRLLENDKQQEQMTLF